MRRLIRLIPAIFLLFLWLPGCGGGGGGGGTPPAPVSLAICNSPAGPSNTMPVCFSGADGPDIPYVTVYIDGKPFNLLLDTGVTGILVNQSALQAAGINMAPNSNTFSGSFADGTTFSGFVNGAQVSTLASGGLSTTSNFQIAVDTGGNAFPSSSALQGDFGMGLSSSVSFGLFGGGAVPTPSLVQGIENGNFNNGFLMQLSPGLNGDGYSYSGSGQLIFGLNSQPDNSTSGFSFFPNDPSQTQSYPVIDSESGGLSKNPSGNKYKSILDTGSNFIFMENSAIANAAGIGENALASHEYQLPSSTPVIGSITLVKGGLNLSVGFYTGSVFDSRASFVTSPNDSSANFEFPASAFTGVPSGGYILISNAVNPQPDDGGLELMGLPYLLTQPMYWQVSPYGIGIKFP